MHRLIPGIFLFVFLCLGLDLFGQEEPPILLRNPSFEDYDRLGTSTSRPPKGWFDCGKPGETAPDIHSSKSAHFDVVKPALHENTYLGLVVRDNETWEAVSQRLPRSMEAGRAYSFGIHLARAENYISPGRISLKETNFNTPIKIRIWGGNNYCDKAELLDESPLVDHTSWKQYQFRFEPKKRHSYILIEAFYKTPVIIPPNGNILVDHATPIFPVPIDKPSPPLPKNDPPYVEILNPKRSGLKSEDNSFTVKATVKNVRSKNDINFLVNGRRTSRFSFDRTRGAFRAPISLVEGDNKIRIVAKNINGSKDDEAMVVYFPKRIVASPPTNPRPDPPVAAKPPVVKENYVLTPELNKKPQSGKKIRIEKLYFQADSSRISEDAFPVLDEFAKFLKSNPDVNIEIGGHTNNRCHDIVCNRLSEDRAKAVANYLGQKGIASRRLKYKGYGKNEPIANNESSYGRRKNQRVEIKIL